MRAKTSKTGCFHERGRFLLVALLGVICLACANSSKNAVRKQKPVEKAVSQRLANNAGKIATVRPGWGSSGLPDLEPGAKTMPPQPPFPYSGRVLTLGQDAPQLTELLAIARPGDQLLVPPGTWRGGTIRKSVALIGMGGVFDGEGQGTVLRLEAADALLEGLILQGSGRNLRGPDAGLYLAPSATGSRVKDLTIRNCLFGIWVHETAGVQLIDNRIEGETKGHPSNRGNGIQLFDAKNLLVSGNQITGGRDGIYVAATENSWIQDNRTHGVRYGIHYMFSYGNSILRNQSYDNSIGYALMQSRLLIVRDNLARNNSGHGLFFRDAQYCDIAHNRLQGNGEGLFFYSSNDNQIWENQVQHNKVGAKIWAGCYRNSVSGNRFEGNDKQIFYVGASDLDWGVEKVGNHWSDYLGWDQDGDGVGDRPYRVNSFSSHLLYRYPASGLLLRSPALELLSHLERILPLFREPTVVDHAPLLRSERGSQAPPQFVQAARKEP